MMGRRLLFAFAAVMPFAGAVSWLRSQPAPWLINETGSLPRGLYQRTATEPQVGALVVIAPPKPARRYLAGLGATGPARLLKRVVAGPGERVCRDGVEVTWPRGVTIARLADRRGRELPAWSGCRRLEADEFFLLGDTATSFDGRYFGPVRRGAIQGVYREVWRW